MLYERALREHKPGKRNEGFRAWLKKHGIPATTAYRWIRRFAEEAGVNPLAEPKGEPKVQPEPAPDLTTSYQMAQGGLPDDDEMPFYIYLKGEERQETFLRSVKKLCTRYRTDDQNDVVFRAVIEQAAKDPDIPVPTEVRGEGRVGARDIAA